jgi:hypothetical protein
MRARELISYTPGLYVDRCFPKDYFAAAFCTYENV